MDAFKSAYWLVLVVRSNELVSCLPAATMIFSEAMMYIGPGIAMGFRLHWEETNHEVTSELIHITRRSPVKINSADVDTTKRCTIICVISLPFSPFALLLENKNNCS